MVRLYEAMTVFYTTELPDRLRHFLIARAYDFHLNTPVPDLIVALSQIVNNDYSFFIVAKG